MDKLFALKLKEYRKELGVKRNKKVTQIQLAKELGISPGNIGDLESSRRLPSKVLLTKLAEHSGKSLEFWMDGINEYEAPNTLDLVLDKMIEKGLISSTDITDECWKIIREAVLLEVERKLK